jgi:hypothetical protein
MRTRTFLVSVFVSTVLAACSGGSQDSGFTDGTGSGSNGANGANGGNGGSNGGSGGIAGNGGNQGGSSGGTASGAAYLYAHTDTTLYQYDPADMTAAPKNLGTFDCVKSGAAMTDLGITKDGALFGVSEGAAYPLVVQNGSVHCSAMWSLPNTKFYGLTIAPENTVAATEVLIGADGQGGLWQIDQASGTPTQVGTLGTDASTNLPWSLSGDIVFMANGGNPIGFATVRTCSKSGTCSTTDTLIEVDVGAIKPGKQSVLKTVRGPVVRGSWCTNASSPSTFGSMFGIVAYQDKVFGFSRKGDVIEIHNTDGTGCLISSDSSMSFAGAGITTSAPVVAPGVK